MTCITEMSWWVDKKDQVHFLIKLKFMAFENHRVDEF